MLLAKVLRGDFIKPCCVRGCTDRYSTRHRYPTYDTKECQFREWSWRIGRLDFIVDPKLASFASVCGCHFPKNSNKLNKDALPTNYLPGIGQHPDLPPPHDVEIRTRDENTGPYFCLFIKIFIMCNFTY